jgi:hypothetical protein
MKKIALLVLLVFCTVELTHSSILSTRLNFLFPGRTMSCVANYKNGGSWYTLKIGIEETPNGYQIQYHDKNGRIFNSYPVYAIPLNPNNELARNNNLTHYANTQDYGTFYFSVYECR